MDFARIILSLGPIGFFASRVFLPAFLSALALRFGPHIPMIEHSGLLAHIPQHPTWFTSDPCLLVLGILAGVEVLAQKNGEAQRLLHEVDVLIKPATAALNAFGVISATDAGFVQHATHQAGWGSSILPLLAAIGTLYAALARQKVLRALTNHLAGTSLGRLVSWLEELWIVFGMFLLILAPIFMLAIIALSLGALALLRWRFAVREELRRVPCSRCATLVYPCAVTCPSCKLPFPNPVDVGFLGQSKPYPAPDPARHPYRLAEKRRCPQCATNLPARDPLRPCSACGHQVMSDPVFASAYADRIALRLPMVLIFCALISAVPLLGLVVGVLYYRIELVEPFYQYLPVGRRMILQIGLSVLAILVILFQWIPAVGALAVPLLAMASFLVYRNSFREFLQTRLSTSHV